MAKRRVPSSEREINQKIQSLKSSLEQLQEMKKILAADGIKPDEDDKRRESKIIQQLLGLEKDLGRLAKGKLERTVKVPFQKAKERSHRAKA